MKEIWKHVQGYEGYYEISNKGRTKSLARIVISRNKPRHLKERILSVRKHHRYNYVSAAVLLHKDREGKETQVSRLVAQAFINNPENKPCVNHIDNNATNNVYTNLEWVTHRENMDYAKDQGRLGRPLVKEFSTPYGKKVLA